MFPIRIRIPHNPTPCIVKLLLFSPPQPPTDQNALVLILFFLAGETSDDNGLTCAGVQGAVALPR